MDKMKKIVLANVGAGVLMLGSIGMVAGVAVSQHNAETEALCAAAVTTYADAVAVATAASDEPSGVVADTEDTELPDEAGVSTPYADRGPEGGHAGAEHSLSAVTAARAAVAAAEDLEDAPACADRDTATAIAEAAGTLTADARDLENATAALAEDFAEFQEAETARLEAEAEAERVAAEEEAARAAAEEAVAGWSGDDQGW